MLASPELPAVRRSALEAYVSEVRALLRLAHWTLMIPDEWPEEGDEVLAVIVPGDQRYIAHLRLGPGFWGLDPSDQRNSVVHELLHLHHVRLTDAVRLGQWRQQVGQGLYDHLIDQVKREAELMVDALTSVIAPAMPLPPAWPDDAPGH